MRLPDFIMPSIHNLLCNVSFTSLGQRLMESETMTMGVAQGDPASPTLYNICMDTFLGATDAIQSDSNAAMFFADDVLLAAETSNELQALLTIATKWVADYHMTWVPHKSFVVSMDRQLQGQLANDTLDTTKSTTYIGSTIGTYWIAEHVILKRHKDGLAKLQQWKRMEEQSLNLPRQSKLKLAKSVLLPMAELGLHLCEIKPAVKSLATDLAKSFTQWIIPTCTTAEINRGLTLLRLTDIVTRRKILCHKRLQQVYRNDVSTNQNLSPTSRNFRLAFQFYDLLFNHTALKPKTHRLNLQHPTQVPASTADASTAAVVKFKKKESENFWHRCNRTYRRIIPVSNNLAPAYCVKNVTHNLTNFIDRWYLGNLYTCPDRGSTDSIIAWL